MAPASLKRKLLAFESGARKTAPSKKAPQTKSSIKVQREIKPATSSSFAAKAEPTVPKAPLKPKVEYSPNARARCHGCRKKISKEHKRFGIPEHCARYDKEIYRYYHVRCCPARYQQMVPDAVGELARQKQLVKDKERIMEERADLVKDLKQLRLLFANRLEVSFFLVFNNDVLKELVVHMPTTLAQLLNIHGIGPAKVQSFGDPIIQLIQQYKRKMKRATASDRKVPPKSERTNSENKSREAPNRKPPPAASKVMVIDDDEGQEIIMGASLSCEQLVQQKFEHAAANGYVISVDD